eukprot:augustus_masked-scaffold_42-processed-gene-0.35-mRNA-1 protein AED:0.94 eAED:1.00 QI:0/-1/0/1/-1/1/1/0/203
MSEDNLGTVTLRYKLVTGGPPKRDDFIVELNFDESKQLNVDQVILKPLAESLETLVETIELFWPKDSTEKVIFECLTTAEQTKLSKGGKIIKRSIARIKKEYRDKKKNDEEIHQVAVHRLEAIQREFESFQARVKSGLITDQVDARLEARTLSSMITALKGGLSDIQNASSDALEERRRLLDTLSHIEENVTALLKQFNFKHN